MSLRELLRDRRSEIMERFTREVERLAPPPQAVSRSALVDHLPMFLDDISSELAAGNDARAGTAGPDVSTTARRHGEQRWSLGYDVVAIVREYGLLRHVILETGRAAGTPLSAEESDTLAGYIDVGVGAAVAEYARSSEEQLRSRQADLEFLAEAGELLGSSLDYQSTLTRLTRLLVPRLADFCIVQLDGSPPEQSAVADVNPERVAMIRALLETHPSQAGGPSRAEVASTGKSVLVESVTEGFLETIAQTPEHLAQLRELGPVSWLVVPLRVQATSLGTITLAMSESGRHYKVADLLLAEDLARSAAAAIDNARLFALSKEERARAESAARAKDEFVAMVSHELRTPLNVIIGWLRLLRSGSVPEKTREQALAVVERNANAQSQLVSDLLDISRSITGSVQLRPAQVDLANIVSLAIEDARFAIEAKRLRLSSEIAPAGTVLRADGERLRQVVANILLNAIKFTPKDGEIAVTLRRVDSELEVTISDTGIGIAAEFLPHVFDSFRQADSKTTRSHGGLGIGLSIAKHIVELHAGDITVQSDGIGRGASFIVRLPISPVISTTVGVSRVPATTPQRREMARPEVLAGTTILVVDDERDARELLRIVLESCSAKVLDASSARAALHAVESHPIDLIISDIGMPEEDGYSLIKNVRALADKTKAATPAMALTAFAGNEDRTTALLAGFNMHMSTPVEPAELLVALADLAGAASRRR